MKKIKKFWIKFWIGFTVSFVVAFSATLFALTVYGDNNDKIVELTSFANESSWQIGSKWTYHYKNGAGQEGTFEATANKKTSVEGSPLEVMEVILLLTIGELQAEQVQYLDLQNSLLVAVQNRATIGLQPKENGQTILLDPPMINYSWPLEVGKKWEGTFDIVIGGFSMGDMAYRAVVEKKETVKVPAGEFDAFKIVEVSTTASRSFYKKEKWYSPRAQNVVKEISYLNNGNLEYIKELQDYQLR